jgi:hypothetical protein
MKTSNAAIIAAINSMTALLNVGGAGTINIYDTANPADLSVAHSGVLLGTVTLNVTAFPSATDGAGTGTATANAIVAGTAVAAGTAIGFRAFDGNGLAVIDGDAAQGSGELNLDDNTFEINDTINVTSWVVSMAE